MLIRSKTLSLQIPGASDHPDSKTVTPSGSTSSSFSSVAESCPDFQRVTISGDYCAGVCARRFQELCILYICIFCTLHNM